MLSCVQEDEDTDKPKIEDLDEDEEDEDKEKSKDKKKKKKIKEKYTEVGLCVLAVVHFLYWFFRSSVWNASHCIAEIHEH